MSTVSAHSKQVLEPCITFNDLPVNCKIHVLTYLDLPDLAQFGLTCRAAHELVSDHQIWRSIAQRIHCPIDNDFPSFNQVLNFIRVVQGQAAYKKVEDAFDKKQPNHMTILKVPNIDQINRIQHWLQEAEDNKNVLQLITKIAEEFPNLMLDGLGNIDNRTDEERIRLISAWRAKNETLLKARDVLILWGVLAATANLPGPNLAELNTREAIIDKSREFNAWFNKNRNEFVELEDLFLYDKVLSSIPEQIGQLTQLQSLDLSNNQLTTVPEWIGQLSQLRRLGLSSNQLNALPEQIGKCSQLQVLDLSSNKFTQLPKPIGKFSQLRELNCTSNQLTTCPEWLSRLTKLVSLTFSYNYFTSLPVPIKQLCSLISLNFVKNQLTTIPEWVRHLPHLRMFDASCNQLTARPEWEKHPEMSDRRLILILNHNPLRY